MPTVEPGEALPKALLDKLSTRFPPESDSDGMPLNQKNSVSMSDCDENHPCEGETSQ
jgi:hypothetical protein